MDGKDRLCGHPDCSVSTGIHGAITFGRGALDKYGFWEFPCSVCARRAEGRDGVEMYTYWPHRPGHGHDEDKP